MNQWMDCSCCLCGGRVVKLASRSFCVCVCVCGRIDSIEHVLFLCSLALDCSTEKKAPNTPKERREQQEQREKEGKMLLCCCRAVVL